MIQNKIVVTGAAGFLGGRTAPFLAERFPGCAVVATSRRNHRRAELEALGCTFLAGDLADPAFCAELVRGATAVVHCAALSSPWGPYEQFHRSNIVATHTLLEACREQGVPRFVFISSPSIYFVHADRYGVAESDPLPARMVNHYAATKWAADQFVLAQNGNGIATISLRPRAIIGAGDTVIFPRVLEAHRQGKLRIIGKGDNRCDLTCVRNVMEAISLCLEAGPEACGKSYNITNGEPVPLWQTLDYLLRQLGLEPGTAKVPLPLAMLAARMSEWKALLLRDKKEPALTTYGIGILARNFTLDITQAREVLGYRPQQTTLEGINEFVQWYKTNN